MAILSMAQLFTSTTSIADRYFVEPLRGSFYIFDLPRVSPAVIHI